MNNKLTFYCLGTDYDPISQEEIESFDSALKGAFEAEPSIAHPYIITHNAVRIEQVEGQEGFEITKNNGIDRVETLLEVIDTLTDKIKEQSERIQELEEKVDNPVYYVEMKPDDIVDPVWNEVLDIKTPVFYNTNVSVLEPYQFSSGIALSI